MPTAPRWFPGYAVAAAATVAVIASAPGQTFVLSQVNGPLRATFELGELELNGAYTVATVAAALPLVLVGRWTDRLGPRRALALAGLAASLACLALSAATGLVGVFLGFFLLRLFTAGALSLISQHALAMWFHRRLGSVHGAVQVVLYGAWVLAPQLALSLVATLGWRGTYVCFGGLVAALVIPLALLLVRDRPEDLGLAPDGDPPAAPREPSAPAPDEPGFTLAEAARTRAYWILAAAAVVPPLIGTALIFDMQPILGERGLPADDAALAVSAWSGATCLWAVPAGLLTDRWQPHRLLAAGLAAIAAASLSLATVSSVWGAVLAVSLLSVGNSTVTACSTAALARYFGRRHHGAIRSSVIRLAIVGTGLGTLSTGLSAELADSYLPALVGFALMCLPILALALSLRPPASPAGQV